MEWQKYAALLVYTYPIGQDSMSILSLFTAPAFVTRPLNYYPGSKLATRTLLLPFPVICTR